MTSKGFTLVELLTVITIIAVLAGIGLVNFQGVQSKGRDSTRKQDLRALSSALEIYFQKNDGYIDGTPGVEGDCTGADSAALYSGIISYMANQKVPVDPGTSTQYCYISLNSGQSFRLFAKLENCSDKDIIDPGSCTPSDWNFSLASQDLTIALVPTAGPSPTTAPTSPPSSPTPTTAPTAVPTPTPTCPGPTDGLYAYWKMDETSGNTIISAVASPFDDGSAIDTTIVPGKLGNARHFDGITSRIGMPSSIKIPNYNGTVSVWVRPAGTSGYIAGVGSDSDNFWLSMLSNVYGFIIADETYRVSRPDPPIGVWTMVTLTWDASGLKLYYNAGTPVTNSNQPGIFPHVGLTIGTWGFGTYSEGAFFTGDIDEFGIWNPALTPTQISTLYNNGAGIPCP